MNKNKLYRYYGVLLSDVERVTGIKKKELHIALKTSQGIDTLTKLTKESLYAYICEIIAFFASEYGIELPLSEESKELKELWS